jgi:hypothetical protein
MSSMPSVGGPHVEAAVDEIACTGVLTPDVNGHDLVGTSQLLRSRVALVRGLGKFWMLPQSG